MKENTVMIVNEKKSLVPESIKIDEPYKRFCSLQMNQKRHLSFLVQKLEHSLKKGLYMAISFQKESFDSFSLIVYKDDTVYIPSKQVLYEDENQEYTSYYFDINNEDIQFYFELEHDKEIVFLGKNGFYDNEWEIELFDLKENVNNNNISLSTWISNLYELCEGFFIKKDLKDDAFIHLLSLQFSYGNNLTHQLAEKSLSNISKKNELFYLFLFFLVGNISPDSLEKSKIVNKENIFLNDTMRKGTIQFFYKKEEYIIVKKSFNEDEILLCLNFSRQNITVDLMDFFEYGRFFFDLINLKPFKRKNIFLLPKESFFIIGNDKNKVDSFFSKNS